MKFCIINNGDCFIELGLESDWTSSGIYSGPITPTEEIFDAVKSSAHKLLAISYGNRLKLEAIDGHRLVVVPTIKGRASFLCSVYHKIRENIIPIYRSFFMFHPDYIISVSGFTFRHLIPLLYCILSRCRLVMMFPSEYPGYTSERFLGQMQARLVVALAKMKVVKIVGVSSKTVYSQLRKAGVKDSRLRVLYPCFRITPIRSVSKNECRRNDQFVVVFIGRLVKEKDPLLFVELAYRLCRLRKIDNARFLMIGGGGLRESIRERIKQLDLENRISMLGFLNFEEVFYHLEKSDVVVMPSRFEAFGRVAVEALIAGVPVVASEVGGLKDIIVDGENGFLCGPGNVAEFEERVYALYEDFELRKSMINNIQKHGNFWLKQRSAFGELVADLISECASK